MNNNARIFALLVVASAALAVMAALVAAANTDPLPPTTLNRLSDARLNTSYYASQSEEAEAGNVTELQIVGTGVTKFWQGYFGNVTGTITLDDADDNTMYDWSDAEPQGEIYASLASAITWADIDCWDQTQAGGTNLTIEESRYGMASNGVDGIDETFNITTHPELVVGTYNVTQNTCWTTHTYINGAYQTTYFYEVLLTDTVSMIYTTIIENDNIDAEVENTTDIIGFDGFAHDFQMLVAEDGSMGDDTSTTYYFWVELS
ncbi:MAG: hypothetical protein ABIA93_04180 [Candidatus Woesearchaeota archaeon]